MMWQIVGIWLSVLLGTTAGIQVEVQPRHQVLLQYEPAFMETSSPRIRVVNTSGRALAVGENLWRMAGAWVRRNGEWTECVHPVGGIGGGIEIQWHVVQPGEVILERHAGVEVLYCLCKDIGRCREWYEVPGVYTFRVVWAHRRPGEDVIAMRRTPPPAGVEVLDAAIEVTYKVEIRAPVGVDAEAAAAWLQCVNAGEINCRAKMAYNYPTSRYAAWVVVQQLGIVGFWGRVERQQQSVEAYARASAEAYYRWWRYYRGDIRMPSEWWARLYFPRREQLQQRVQWLEGIVRLHADFPYGEEVRAVLATYLLALGHLQRGIGLLRDLARHARQQRMRQWAGVFLATWQQWMGQ